MDKNCQNCLIATRHFQKDKNRQKAFGNYQVFSNKHKPSTTPCGPQAFLDEQKSSPMFNNHQVSLKGQK
jgi:hypothetical protein